MLQEENQREIQSTSQISIDATSCHVNVKAETKKIEKSGVVCTNCKKTGHVIDKCYFLIGFPSKNNKPKKLGDAKEFAAQVSTESSSAIPGLNAEQFERLMSMLSVKPERNQTNSPIDEFAGFVDMCFLQDHAGRRILNLGNARRGLYYLERGLHTSSKLELLPIQ